MSEKEKNNHTLLKVIGGVTAAGAAAYGGFGYVVFRNAFDLQHSTLYGGKQSVRKLNAVNGEKSEWFAHSDREDEFLESYDGLKLHALKISNHNDAHKWIILVHGVGSYSGGMLEYMSEADERGFNILAVDHRGCGMSEGRYTGLGWPEHYDLISWVNFLINLDPQAEIALLGVDAGGTAVMNAIGDYIPSNVKCAVEDGGFSGIKEILNYGIRKYCKVEGKPFLPGVDFFVKQCLHFSINDVSTKHQLQMATTPILFAQGTEDEVVPTSMLFDNYYACASEKDLYTAEGKGFGETWTAPDYFETVFGFIGKYIQ